MAKVIAVSNHKGGVGKTTSVVNLGAALAASGSRVLVVDLDPQANLTISLSGNAEECDVYRCLTRGEALKPQQIQPGYDLLPTTLDLSGAEVELASEVGREYILKELLEPVQKAYDYILIDCPPSLGLLTVNAFCSADYILIPIQAQYLALQGLTKLQQVITKIQERLNKKLTLLGVFLTQYDKRKVLHREIAEALGASMKQHLLEVVIRDNISLAEAPLQGSSIFNYAPQSPGAQDYKALSEEIQNKVNSGNNSQRRK